MRLINTKTGYLEEFIGDDIPRYAILSHTWGKEEISLQDLQRMMDPDLANDQKTWEVKEKKGFIKILRFVELAASKDIPYAWADTCCIDKTSSADLSESINSMYRWYKNSVMCFAYLADVASEEWHPYYKYNPEVAKSRWFTRGWTLQELLAPYTVEFTISLGSFWMKREGRSWILRR
jgi:Heterokaryon incompatibility protein (HET)